MKTIGIKITVICFIVCSLINYFSGSIVMGSFNMVLWENEAIYLFMRLEAIFAILLTLMYKIIKYVLVRGENW